MRILKVLLVGGLLLFCVTAHTAAQDRESARDQATDNGTLLESRSVPLANLIFTPTPSPDARVTQPSIECDAQTDEKSTPCTPGFAAVLQIQRGGWTGTVGAGGFVSPILGPGGIVFSISDEALRMFYESRDRDAKEAR